MSELLMSSSKVDAPPPLYRNFKRLQAIGSSIDLSTTRSMFVRGVHPGLRPEVTGVYAVHTRVMRGGALMVRQEWHNFMQINPDATNNCGWLRYRIEDEEVTDVWAVPHGSLQATPRTATGILDYMAGVLPKNRYDSTATRRAEPRAAFAAAETNNHAFQDPAILLGLVSLGLYAGQS